MDKRAFEPVRACYHRGSRSGVHTVLARSLVVLGGTARESSEGAAAFSHSRAASSLSRFCLGMRIGDERRWHGRTIYAVGA